VLLPEYPRVAYTASDAPASALTIELVEAPYWLAPEASVIMIYGERTESRRVDSVGENSVTFKSAGVGEPWPAGTAIHWGLSGLFNVEIESQRETTRTARVSVQFKVNPTSELEVVAPTNPVIFDSREVFLKRPNWAQRPTVTYMSEREEVDYGRGRIARFTPVDFTSRMVRSTYIGRSLDEADQVLEHFKRMKGQRGEFYMPTWENDLPLKSPLVQGTTVFRLDGPDIYDTYRDNTVMRAIYIQKRDGSYLFNTVNSIFQVTDADGTGDSVLNCGSPWTEDVEPSQIEYVSWMPIWRYGSDKVSFDGLTTKTCQFQLTMRTVESLPRTTV
jgi:hypothetical protein